MTKLEKLANLENTTVIDLIEDAVYEDSCKGICMNENCDYTALVEIDQTSGYCEVCRTNTVKSAAILGGII